MAPFFYSVVKWSWCALGMCMWRSSPLYDISLSSGYSDLVQRSHVSKSRKWIQENQLFDNQTSRRKNNDEFKIKEKKNTGCRRKKRLGSPHVELRDFCHHFLLRGMNYRTRMATDEVFEAFHRADFSRDAFDKRRTSMKRIDKYVDEQYCCFSRSLDSLHWKFNCLSLSRIEPRCSWMDEQEYKFAHHGRLNLFLLIISSTSIRFTLVINGYFWRGSTLFSSLNLFRSVPHIFGEQAALLLELWHHTSIDSTGQSWTICLSSVFIGKE